MSSLKKLNMCRSEKCNGNVGHSSDDSRVTPKRRNMPPILRLDSTGEVTTHDFGGNNAIHCDRKCQFSKKMNRSFQNLVHYVGAASSFIDVRAGISKHLSDNRNPFDCVRKMLNVSNIPFNGCKPEQNMAEIVTKEAQPHQGSPAVGMGQDCAHPFFKKHLSSWSDNVFGAFHSRNSCSPWDSLQRQTYYNHSPYRRRPEVWQKKRQKNFSDNINDSTCTIDPSLKPYNARLLQKSRQLKKDNAVTNHTTQPDNCVSTASTGNDSKNTESFQKNTEIKTKPQDLGLQNLRIPDNSDETHTASVERDLISFGNDSITTSSKQLDVAQISDLDTADHITTEKLTSGIIESHSRETKPISNNAEGKKSPLNNENVTDWFEYESKDLKTIPIDLQNIEQKCTSAQSSPETDAALVSVCPPLHSWFSIDFDSDSVRCKSEDLTKNQTESVDNRQIVKEQGTEVDSSTRQSDKNCDIKKVNVKIEKLDSDSKSKPKQAEIRDSSECDKSFILYVRNLKKASKPSCKKRRRQRAKKESNNDEKSEINQTGEKIPEQPEKKCKDNPVAFILGAYSSGKAQPFLVSCDIDSDSDWSDSGNECDELPEENIPDELSMFAFCDNLNPLNFKLTCSVQSASPIENSSRIDAVNLSWQVNVCVSTATQNRKSTDKKVHFANEEDLVVIHPVSQLAEWSEAYEEARKGPWVQCALDRERFRKRITDLETVLNPILVNGHRERVYKDRFCEN